MRKYRIVELNNGKFIVQYKESFIGKWIDKYINIYDDEDELVCSPQGSLKECEKFIELSKKEYSDKKHIKWLEKISRVIKVY